MKKLIALSLLAVVLLSACESPSGRRARENNRSEFVNNRHQFVRDTTITTTFYKDGEVVLTSGRLMGETIFNLYHSMKVDSVVVHYEVKSKLVNPMLMDRNSPFKTSSLN